MPPEKLQTPSILVESNTAKTICIILLYLGPVFFLVVIHCINPVSFLESESQLCLCILEIRSSINLCFLEIRISTFLFILEFGSSMSICFLEFWNSKLDQSLRSGTWIGRSSICLCVLEFEEVIISLCIEARYGNIAICCKKLSCNKSIFLIRRGLMRATGTTPSFWVFGAPG